MDPKKAFNVIFFFIHKRKKKENQCYLQGKMIAAFQVDRLIDSQLLTKTERQRRNVVAGIFLFFSHRKSSGFQTLCKCR